MKYFNILILLFFLSACGGSGGGNSPSSGSSSLVPKQLNLRIPKTGDKYEYKYTMNYNSTNTIISRTGDMVKEYINQKTNLKGVTCDVFKVTITFGHPSEKVTITSIGLTFTDETGRYNCGFYDADSGQYVFIDNDNGLIKIANNPMTPGDILTPMVTYNDGTWSDCTLSYSSQNTISVDAGNFEAFGVSNNCSESDGSTSIHTSFIDPKLGALLKDDVEINYDDGSSMNIKIELTDYTLI